MISETSCPICRLEHIPSDRDQCPQCDSDLTCFRVLAAMPSLSETAAPNEPEKPSSRPAAGAARSPFYPVVIGILFVLLVFLIWEQFYGIRRVETRLDQQRAGLDKAAGRIVSAIDRQAQRLDGMFSTLAEQIKTVRETKFFNYPASETDTLWDIAHRFYGAGRYYPVLLLHNPHLAIYKIGKKDTVAVLKDITPVDTIYRRITEIIDGYLYWYYTIRPGDTETDLIHKYCPGKKGRPASPCIDPRVELQPGHRIRIRLE
ncbi:MAG: hypothetical protein JRH15_11920 [Deltaproteobacteria bacterium]|nr:hypothetical protein [Deltaproteobacteria bacterium]